MKIETIYPGNKEYQILDDRLVNFNRQHINWDSEIFQVVIYSKNNDLVGGVRGIVRMGALEIRGLWLDESQRGTGNGAKVISRLEAEAKKHGAKSALLDTYDFQAREFYEQLGYKVFGTFPYPDGTNRYYMQKLFA